MALTQISTQGIKDGTITGTDLATDFTTTGDFTFTGDTSVIRFDKSDDALEFADNMKATFGNSGDLAIFHNGTYSRIEDVGTGHFELTTNGTSIDINKGTTEYMARFFTDGAVELYHDNSKKLETFADGIKVVDDGSVVEIELITNSSAVRGKVTADSGNQVILATATDENMLIAKADGAVELYYDNSKKFETTSTGVSVTGNIQLPDDGEVRLGADSDIRMFHSGTQNLIQSYNDKLFRIQSFGTSAQIRIQTNEGENNIVCSPNAGVELYYDNSKKFETTSTGVDILGSDTTGSNLNGDLVINNAAGTRYAVFDASHTKLNFSDNALITLGTSNDLQIYHDGNNNLILGSPTVLIKNNANTESYIRCNENAQVELYYNNSKQFETTSTGSTTFGTHHSTSDIALKTNIKPITNTLEKIQQITGYKYKFIKSNENSIGVVAQEVEKVFPELVAGTEGNKTLQYNGLIGVLIEAVKELSAEVAALKAS